MVPTAGSRPRRTGGEAERDGEDDGVETSEADSSMGEGDRGGGEGADLRGLLEGAGRVSLERDFRFWAGREEGSGDGSSSAIGGEDSGIGSGTYMSNL